MRNLLLAFTVAAIPYSGIYAETPTGDDGFVRIDDYLEEMLTLDPSERTFESMYLSMRCAAVNLAFSVMLEKSSHLPEEAQVLHATTKSFYELFSTYSLDFAMALNKVTTERQRFDVMSRTVERILELNMIYAEYSESYYLKNGNSVYEGMTKDLRACNSL